MSSQWIDQPTEVRAGEEVDGERLAAFLRRELPDFEGPIEIAQFPRGYSNLTYLVRVGSRPLVLRRPPVGAAVRSGHDMGREHRILARLSPVWGKAPAPLAWCSDPEVIGAPFYVMERIEGVILRPRMPPEARPSAERMAAIAEGFIETLAELHTVDYQTAGLADLGRPEGYVRRQIDGWTERYERARTDDVSEMTEVARWLDSRAPEESGAALIHNDFKYDNLVLDPQDGTRVVAVLDWEMATLGDPLMDLGTTLGYWVEPDDPPVLQQLALSPTLLPGNPSRSQLLERYIIASGRQVDDPAFYYAYGLFKVAVIAQQIYARYRAGHTQDPRFAQLIHAVRTCAQVAARAAELERIDNLF